MAPDFAPHATGRPARHGWPSCAGGPVVYDVHLLALPRTPARRQVQTIRGALDDLGHDVPVLGVSVDPGQRHAGVARSASCNEQQMTGRMSSCSARSAQLAPVWRAFGIAPQRGSSTTPPTSCWSTPRGRQRDRASRSTLLTTRSLAHDLRRLGVTAPLAGDGDGERVLRGVLAVLRGAVDEVVAGGRRSASRRQ